jgi:hypothetical protein
MNIELLGWEYLDGDDDDWNDEIEESDLFMDMDLSFEFDDEDVELEDFLYDLDLDWFDELELFWKIKGEYEMGSGWVEMSHYRFDKWDRWDSNNYEEDDWDKFLRLG